MIVKKVLVYIDDTLLKTGVTSLISKYKEFELVVMHAQTPQHLLEASTQLKPDAIIVERKFLNSQEDVLGLLYKCLSNTRVITVDEQDNLLHVYIHFGIPVTQSSDLIGIIRSGYKPNFYQ